MLSNLLAWFGWELGHFGDIHFGDIPLWDPHALADLAALRDVTEIEHLNAHFNEVVGYSERVGARI